MTHLRTTMRTHACGELTRRARRRRRDLCGWVAHRRDHGGVTFIDLRDREGVVQVVFHPEDAAEAHAAAQRLRERGRRAGHRRRPPRGRTGMANPQLATGEVEVAASILEVLVGAPTRRRSRSRIGSRRARSCACATATSTSAGRR